MYTWDDFVLRVHYTAERDFERGQIIIDIRDYQAATPGGAGFGAEDAYPGGGALRGVPGEAAAADGGRVHAGGGDRPGAGASGCGARRRWRNCASTPGMCTRSADRPWRPAWRWRWSTSGGRGKGIRLLAFALEKQLQTNTLTNEGGDLREKECGITSPPGGPARLVVGC